MSQNQAELTKKAIEQNRKAILFFNALTLWTPLFFAFFIAFLLRVITPKQLGLLIESVSVRVASILFLIYPLINTRYHLKKITSYDGSQDTLKTASKAINTYQVLTLAVPLLAGIILPVFMSIENVLHDPKMSYVFLGMGTGAVSLFSIAFYIPFYQKLETSLQFLPLKTDHKGLSFGLRSLTTTVLSITGSLLISLTPVLWHLSNADSDTSKIFIGLGLACFTTIVATIYNTIESRRIATQLKTIAGFATSLADGDYRLQNLPVLRRDELGILVNDMNVFFDKTKELLLSLENTVKTSSVVAETLSANITETVSSMQQISANIDSVKKQNTNQTASVEQAQQVITHIVQNIQQLNDRIDVQAVNVTESSASIEEMLANINSVTQILENNNKTIETLHTETYSGKKKLEETTQLVAKIAEKSEAMIEASSVIQNIAAQTNLLAMNAAIEAAHAGHAGRGFAVVADAIRKLSEESSTQGKRISLVLSESKSYIDSLNKAAQDVAKRFEDVYKLSSQIKDQEAVIVSAMQEQGIGNAQVFDAVKEINDITSVVKNEAEQMEENSKTAIAEMKKLSMISSEILNSMTEMVAGTRQVNQAAQEANSMTQQNRETVQTLSDEMKKFKL